MAALYPRLLGLFLFLPQAHALPADPAAIQTRLSSLEKNICQELSPEAAESFLKDQPLLDHLKRSDPERQARLFSQAARLKDMKEVLQAHEEAGTLSTALHQRLADDVQALECRGLGFGPRPGSLVEWDARYLASIHLDALKASLWDWDTLSDDQRDWLAARHENRQTWDSRSFVERRVLLAGRAKERYRQLMASVPRSEEDMQELLRGERDIVQVLDDDQKVLLWEKLGKSRTALDSLRKVQGDSRTIADPRLRELLDRARNAGTVDDSLAALSQLFDKLGIQDKLLAAQRPAAPDEKLSVQDRGLLADMLGSALLAEVGTAETGRRLQEFFKTHKLQLELSELPGRVGQFHPGANVIIINDKLVMSWLKAEKKAPRDLLRDPKALEGLAMILSGSFVHEATHQEQQAWADERHAPRMYAQHDELEAMSIEALFVLQQAQARKGYKEYLEANQKSYWVCRLDLSLGQRLRSDFREYRRYTMTDQYSQIPSLEAVAADWTRFYDRHAQAVGAELARRAKLPAAERGELEQAGLAELPKTLKSEEEWLAALPRLKTSRLEADLRQYASKRAESIEIYQQSKERYETVITSVDDDLQGLRSGKKPAAKVLVPPPPPTSGLEGKR